MSDPTLDEIREFIKTRNWEFSDFDQEEAIYYFASDYHGGQWTNLYSALCQSEYKPGNLSDGPEECAQYVYDDLVAHYFPDKTDT